MARANKNRLLVSGAVLSVALLSSCTSGDEASPSEHQGRPSLQQGEDPILKAPQAAFYGPPDQNTLCAGA